MIVIRDLDEITEKLPRAVVTIGNFDGVHLGHREIFRCIKQAAAEIDGVSVVVTFLPHPLKALQSEKKLQLISTYAEKELLIEASGVDYLIIIVFTQEFAELSAKQFIKDVMVDQIGARRIIIGYDYAFGSEREGNVELLHRFGMEMGFDVEVMEPIGRADGVIYSSSGVRRMIEAGNVREVPVLLGRHFSIGGIVVHGHHRGKGLGFPTANLETDKELIPGFGVYAVKVKIDEQTYDGACNIGDNPTFGDDKRVIEVYIFDFDGELYGLEVRLYFVEKLRGEVKFIDAALLQKAIAEDVVKCREILQDVVIIEYKQYLKAR